MCFGRKNRWPWFTWWFNHPPGPSISPKRTPTPTPMCCSFVSLCFLLVLVLVKSFGQSPESETLIDRFGVSEAIATEPRAGARLRSFWRKSKAQLPKRAVPRGGWQDQNPKLPEPPPTGGISQRGIWRKPGGVRERAWDPVQFKSKTEVLGLFKGPFCGDVWGSMLEEYSSLPYSCESGSDLSCSGAIYAEPWQSEVCGWK